MTQNRIKQTINDTLEHTNHPFLFIFKDEPYFSKEKYDLFTENTF